ncbi:branched-chain amino acid ABC transporter permease [Bradyrhizobium prioriisuperbiae]|uniref:branched-chain amino acid ABC transporter permease n=1 Tax=Bradyrhizobium prioriisuperbiae TaxID=2854389 RepID=UPI0028E73B5C|nr:branched-chain amino acid ABC transporter permease [Bradyrhizobium prioritasuperba]
MDLTIFLFLLQDGIINGAVYALVALALVLVFAVTRVILIPQGEFVAFATLTVAALENGKLPGTVWLLIALGVLAAVSELVQYRREITLARIVRIAALDLVVPVLLALLANVLAPLKLGPVLSGTLTVLLILPMGPMLYRIAFDPIAKSGVLVLLIAAFGVHFSLMGLGLVFFGPEGVGTAALSSQSFTLGSLVITGQSVMVLLVTVVLLVVFAVFFQWSLFGKALRACASNRIGARLSGIPTALAGQVAFAIAAGLGAVSGVLIGPLMTVYYDSGFLIGLKGFVAAILGGLVSYPLTVLAALGVGFSEALFSFWASSFKEVLVFALIIPVLMWRSLTSAPGGGHN